MENETTWVDTAQEWGLIVWGWIVALYNSFMGLHMGWRIAIGVGLLVIIIWTIRHFCFKRKEKWIMKNLVKILGGYSKRELREKFKAAAKDDDDQLVKFLNELQEELIKRDPKVRAHAMAMLTELLIGDQCESEDSDEPADNGLIHDVVHGDSFRTKASGTVEQRGLTQLGEQLGDEHSKAGTALSTQVTERATNCIIPEAVNGGKFITEGRKATEDKAIALLTKLLGDSSSPESAGSQLAKIVRAVQAGEIQALAENKLLKSHAALELLRKAGDINLSEARDMAEQVCDKALRDAKNDDVVTSVSRLIAVGKLMEALPNVELDIDDLAKRCMQKHADQAFNEDTAADNICEQIVDGLILAALDNVDFDVDEATKANLKEWLDDAFADEGEDNTAADNLASAVVTSKIAALLADCDDLTSDLPGEVTEKLEALTNGLTESVQVVIERIEQLREQVKAAEGEEETSEVEPE